MTRIEFGSTDTSSGRFVRPQAGSCWRGLQPQICDCLPHRWATPGTPLTVFHYKRDATEIQPLQYLYNSLARAPRSRFLSAKYLGRPPSASSRRLPQKMSRLLRGFHRGRHRGWIFLIRRCSSMWVALRCRQMWGARACVAGEALFIPRASVTEEEDGIILASVWSSTLEGWELMVFDARE